MKISLNWLTDYVDITLSAKELGELFTAIGLNCDGIAQTDSDVVFELDVTSNRPDWLGHIGVARELAAATGAQLRLPQIGAIPTSGKAADLTSVQVLDSQLCPRYIARIIHGVKVGKSPDWLVERLAAVGMRSVNNIVDVTNFVLMEYSQPLHSFDYAKLAEHRIVVRRAKGGEQMTAIDGTRCKLDENMLVIADAQRPVAVAGVMGGLDSEVTAATTDILLESAQFDPLSIRRTSRALGLMSESNYRFERGVDPIGVEAASLRACQLIIELADSQMAAGSVDVWPRPVEPAKVTLRPSRTNALLGVDIPAKEQAQLLERLGLGVQSQGDTIACTVPTFRADLTREIDLIEEVARLAGYDKIPLGAKICHSVSPEGALQRTLRQSRAALNACGVDEALTPSFVDAGENELFGVAAPVAVDPKVRRTNNVLRATLLSSLLRCCKTNQDAGNGDVGLFEIAKVFPPDSSGKSKLPLEYTQLGLVTSRELRDLRGAVEALVARLVPDHSAADGTSAPTVNFTPADLPGFAAGGATKITLGDAPLGAIGVIDAAVLAHYGLEKVFCGAVVDFGLLAARAGAVRQYYPLPRFPEVRRDLSLIVDEAVTWSQIRQAIDGLAQPQRVAVDYVTTYRGKPIPDGKKSVTLAIVYRSDQCTLRSEEVDQQVERVTQAMGKAVGAGCVAVSVGAGVGVETGGLTQAASRMQSPAAKHMSRTRSCLRMASPLDKCAARTAICAGIQSQQRTQRDSRANADLLAVS